MSSPFQIAIDSTYSLEFLISAYSADSKIMFISGARRGRGR